MEWSLSCLSGSRWPLGDSPAMSPGWQQGSPGCPRPAASIPVHCHCNSSPTLWVCKLGQRVGGPHLRLPVGTLTHAPHSGCGAQASFSLPLPHAASAHLRGGQKERQCEDGRPRKRRYGVDLRPCTLSSKDCGVSCCQGTYRAQTLCIWCQSPDALEEGRRSLELT